MEIGYLVILGNAFILGIRHGVDWDHVAAITDIVGTAGATKVNASGVASFQQNHAIRLSSCYATGHATIVLILGFIALSFATILPQWIDPLMERAVGVTLLMLGFWILFSLISQPTGGELILQSRWMMLYGKIDQLKNWYCRLKGTTPSEKSKKSKKSTKFSGIKTRQYNATAAFGIGIIHGFGAETGTQVLLIAAVGKTPDHQLAILLLLAFISGLLLSNTLIAILASVGFTSSAKFKPLFIATSVLTGIFSLAIGTLFAFGAGNLLPDLQRHF